MKNFIFSAVILYVTVLFLGGCYTYLSVSKGAQLAVVYYEEPYFPPDEPCPPPPGPRPGPIIQPYIPPSPPYERPDDVIDIRNGGECRNSDHNGRRR